MSVRYDLYVDETFPRGRVRGRLWSGQMLGQRTARVLRDLGGTRADAWHSSEIKWEKTSARTLPFYRDVLDLFFDHRYPRLTVLQIEKTLELAPVGQDRRGALFQIVVLLSHGMY